MSAQISASAAERNYTKLAEVPDMSKLLRGVVKDSLPVLGTKRSATGDPKAAFEVADFTVDREHLAAYTRATGLRYSSELPITYRSCCRSHYLCR